MLLFFEGETIKVKEVLLHVSICKIFGYAALLFLELAFSSWKVAWKIGKFDYKEIFFTSQ